MVGWHHQFDGHEFEWAPGVGDGWEAWCAAVRGVTKSQTQLGNWTEWLFELHGMPFSCLHLRPQPPAPWDLCLPKKTCLRKWCGSRCRDCYTLSSVTADILFKFREPPSIVKGSCMWEACRDALCLAVPLFFACLLTCCSLSFFSYHWTLKGNGLCGSGAGASLSHGPIDLPARLVCALEKTRVEDGHFR